MIQTCYSDLHLSNNWTEQAGDNKQPHGKCSIVHGVGYAPMSVLFTPAVRPPGEGWDPTYILHRNAASEATLWTYIVSVRMPTPADVANCEALELDFQKNDGPMIVNLGWQFLFGQGLRLWNRSVGAWTAKPVAPMPSSLPQCLPTRIVALMEHDGNSVTYLGMSFNGVFTPLNMTFPAVAAKQSPYVNNAVQLDSKGKGAPINLELHECTLVGF